MNARGSLAAIAAAAAITQLPGCASPPTQEQSGMVIGGIVGGVLGSQVGRGSGRTAATIIGTIVGASIGGQKEQVVGAACRQPDGSWRTTG